MDVHQHVWSEPLLDALKARGELPFVREELGLTVLYLAGEQPYVIELAGEAVAQRAALVEHDGLDRALVCLSSPLGIEALPRAGAQRLIDAYHDGALALGDPFGVWGAVALDRADAREVERVLARGCVGLSLPAGALAGPRELGDLAPVLGALEDADAPLLVHPGPGRNSRVRCGELDRPLWWPALTHYVADIGSAWHAFRFAGRAAHPRLRVIFTMLAGLAPLHFERLAARGGPPQPLADPLVFYETSSYGPAALRALAPLVGAEQILYGSDRPVAEPGEHDVLALLDRELLDEAAERALGVRSAPAQGVLR